MPKYSYNITQLCGSISYNVPNLETSIFTLFPNPIHGQPPKITCYTEDPVKVRDNPSENPYRSFWFLDL
jgi:hypothetical protein